MFFIFIYLWISGHCATVMATAPATRPKNSSFFIPISPPFRRKSLTLRLNLVALSVDLLYQRLYQFYSLFHRRMHRLAQLHQHVFVVFSAHDYLRLTAHHEDAGWLGA